MSAAYPWESLFAPAFPRIEEIRTENVLGDVSAKDIAWLCEVAEAATRLCVYMSQVEPMVFKRNAGCERWNRLAGLLQPQTEKLIFPEGDERCDFMMDACTCMKHKGHEGLHACAHGGWR